VVQWCTLESPYCLVGELTFLRFVVALADKSGLKPNFACDIEQEIVLKRSSARDISKLC